MPSADPVMASLATFAATCPFEELPSVTVEATRAATIAGIACALRSKHDRRLEASLRGAGRALGASGGGGFDASKPLTLQAFEIGCRIASADGAPVGPVATPLGLLSLAVLVGTEAPPVLTGKEYLTSVAVGAEVQARLALSVHGQPTVRPRWLPGVLLSYLGVATAASRARLLDHEAIASALGIAVTLASGSRQHLVCSPPLLWLGEGFAALGGTWAALQAASRVDGRFGALVGDWGLLPLWFGVSDAGATTSGLGSDFVVDDVALRPGLTEQLAAYTTAVRALAVETGGAASTVCLHLLPENFAAWQSLEPERRAELEDQWRRSFHGTADASNRFGLGGEAHIELEVATDPRSCGVAARRDGEVVAFRPVAGEGARSPGVVFAAAADELAALARDGKASSERVGELLALVEHLEELDDVDPLRGALSAVLAQ